jgi:hypothetical protein
MNDADNIPESLWSSAGLETKNGMSETISAAKLREA